MSLVICNDCHLTLFWLGFCLDAQWLRGGGGGVCVKYTPANRYSTFIGFGGNQLAWLRWPEIFMITSLFCLLQHFPVMKLLIFIQNFCNYSFVSICWTVSPSQNPLPVVWKLLSSSFKISKNYGVIVIHFLLT